MYSMVLMAALTTGTDMPDWGRRGGCCGCYGGWGWGGCYGCYGGYGWGGCYGCYGGYGWGGRWGGWGGWGGWGYVFAPVAPAYIAPTVVVSNTLPAANSATRSMYYNPNADGTRATVIVHLPEKATLTVDGKPTSSTSSIRRFYSPPLERGQSYHYTFTARMERDGKVVTADQRVELKAGDRREITISLPDVDQSPENRQTATPDRRKAIRDRQRVGG